MKVPLPPSRWFDRTSISDGFPVATAIRPLPESPHDEYVVGDNMVEIQVVAHDVWRTFYSIDLGA